MEADREKNYRFILNNLCELSDESISQMVKYIAVLKAADRKRASTEEYIQSRKKKGVFTPRGKKKRIQKITSHAEIIVTTVRTKGTMEDLQAFAEKYL